MRKPDFEKIIQFVILIITVILLIIGLISGKINKYVHPRFNIGLWISIIILVIFVVSIISDRRKAGHNISYQHYLVYLVPLVFAIAFQPAVISKTDVVLADVSEASSDKQTETEPTGEAQYSSVDEYLQDTQNQQEVSVTPEGQEKTDKADASEPYKTTETDGYYVINDDVFADWFMDLYDHTEDFVGEKYQFLAQVFPMEGLKENQFLAGRDFMVCCAADLVGYGLICESDRKSELEENQWIIVKATIGEGEYEGSKVPKLINAEIEKTKAPKVEYIYYNSY